MTTSSPDQFAAALAAAGRAADAEKLAQLTADQHHAFVLYHEDDSRVLFTADDLAVINYFSGWCPDWIRVECYRTRDGRWVDGWSRIGSRRPTLADRYDVDKLNAQMSRARHHGY